MYPVFIRIGFERLEVAKHPILKEANRMNSHKHARLTYVRRLEMVRHMIECGWSASEAGAAHGVTAATARKWQGRYLAAGEAGLVDASSRPTSSPRAIAPAKALLIVELRRRRMTQADAAEALDSVLSLPLEVDSATGRRVQGETAALARQYGLTHYDAAYLELAMRRGAVLATDDAELAKAARRAGVTVL